MQNHNFFTASTLGGVERYWFGFNRMESEDDLYGEKNAYDFGARIYDARLGRFLSLDPLYRSFAFESNYIFAGNNPIYYIDDNGEKKVTYITTIENGKKTTQIMVNNDYVETVTFMKTINISLGGPQGEYISWTVDVKYNVVEFITIDLDNNRVSTTGNIRTDIAKSKWEETVSKWQESIVNFLDSFEGGSVKQPNQAGGNTLVAPGTDLSDLPGNASRYLPSADNRGEDIDIGLLLGNRGGGEIKGNEVRNAYGKIIEVIQASDGLSDAIKDAYEFSKDAESKPSGNYCNECKGECRVR